MGVMLSSPVELIRVQRAGSSSFKCAVAEMQGWRNSHEDCHAMQCDDNWGSFWVLDGHGGAGAAKHCAPKLGSLFGRANSSQSGATEDERMPTDAKIVEGFEEIDRDFYRYVQTHQDEESGSTVVGSLVSKVRDGSFTVKILNCGDSRGIVLRDPVEEESAVTDFSVKLPDFVSKGSDETDKSPLWPLITATVDHKPDHPVEKDRIVAAGGFVENSQVARLDGNLAVSRGVGDFEYKGHPSYSDPCYSAAAQKVSVVPDVYEITNLQPGAIIVLACDGLWDVMKSEEVGKLVRDRVKQQPKVDLGELCASLIRQSLDRSSRDNVTVMIIHLADGSDWSRPSNRFNESDQMYNFDKLVSTSDSLDEDVGKHYRSFLERCKFPTQPVPCSVCNQWYLSMFKCPGTGNVYCCKSCQKKGWKNHKATADS